MDIEFHYYMTYLIAARAGFAPADAAIIAQAAQEIDDNHLPIRVSAGTPDAYDGTLSQTMDILRPHHNRRIYPIFHFIPGDPKSPSARRRDSLTSTWVTTPNSDLANEMLDTALKSGDLFRIGASAHAYADTWAHQNFLGKDDAYNEMPTQTWGQRIEGEISLMRIGHALAGHQPDIPGLIWTDGRMVEAQIDNAVRFLDAAGHLFRKLAAYKNGAVTSASLDSEVVALVADLRADIGPSSTANIATDPARIARYVARALTPAYGAAPIPPYVEAAWADAAFVEQRADMAQQIALWTAKHAGVAGDILDFATRVSCTWKDPAHREQTAWYKFQEAVRSHLDECWGVLIKRLPEIADVKH